MSQKKLAPLEPVDLRQCQGEKQVGAFALGGRIGHRTRCTNVPTWLALEMKPDSDGRRGAMSLCDECKPICEKQMGTGFATYQEIKR
jgi:hypothetical protein